MNSHYKTEIQRGGRITIPSEMRRQLGLSIGDTVVLDMSDDDVRLRSLKQVVKDIQAMVKPYIPKGVSLVDELIKERRAEAAKEEEELQKWSTPND